VQIPEGFLFYGQPRRRTVVSINAELRELVAATTGRLHQLLDAAALPPAVYEKRKCDACSLAAICQPRAKRSASSWLESEISDLKSQI
jgi:CRISPR-associated exonuclease Cas4